MSHKCTQAEYMPPARHESQTGTSVFIKIKTQASRENVNTGYQKNTSNDRCHAALYMLGV